MIKRISPRALPYIGHLFPYAKNPIEYQSYLFKKYGDLSYITLFGRKLYFPVHPDHVKSVLVTHADRVIKGMSFQNSHLVIGRSVLNTEKDEHLKKRRILATAFSNVAVADYDIYVKKFLKEELLNETSQTCDLVEFCDDLVQSLISNLLFGKSLPHVNDLVKTNLNYGMKIVFRSSISFYKYLLPLPFPSHVKFKRSKKLLEKEFNALIKDRDPKFTKNIFQVLLDSDCTEQEIYDQVLSIFMAGHETSATAIIWMVYSLSAHKFDKERFLEEIKHAFEHDALTKQLDDYIYIKAVIFEALRLYPSAWNIGREVTEDFKLGDQKIYKGDLISLSPFVSQRDPRYFEKPDEFIPERWIDSSGMFRSVDKFVYFPFSQGVRNCIGAKLAMSEFFQFLIYFYSYYDVKAVPLGPFSYKPVITVRPNFKIDLLLKKKD